MAKVFITDYIENPEIEKGILKDLLGKEKNNEIEVLLVWHEKIDSFYIDSFPSLKGVIRYGVGYDNVDLAYARKKNIYVCNTPDYGTDEVSDTAIAMITGIVRGVFLYNSNCKKYTTTWQENTINTIRRNSEVTIGVIGAGRIGGSVVLKCNALKFKTLIYDPFKERGHEKLLNTQRVDSLEELLANSDIVSIHTPLNEDTIGIIDKEFIQKMKKGASLVNTSRGKLIKDLDIIYQALDTNHLSSVALDVLPVEPPLNCELISAWKDPENKLNGRIIINPHTAYFSIHAFEEMRRKVAENALRVIQGLLPYNIVNER